MAQASVVRKLRFLGNCRMDSDQILWEATYPPYLQTFFFFFQNFKFSNFHDFFSFSLTWEPMGAKIAKRYSYHKSLLNFLKLLLNGSLQYPHKVTFSDFKFSDLIFYDF